MKKIRFFAAFLAAVLLLSAAVPAQAANGPQIPGDREDGVNKLNDYEPERDGYFAYLPIRYYADPEHIEESEALEGDLPVIVLNGKIFVSAKILSDISGLFMEENAGKIRFMWQERQLVVTLDRTEASFILGTFRDGQTPYIQERFSLSAAPFRGTNAVIYVPMTDICSIMGVDLYADSDPDDTKRYAVNPPQEDVYDVLASFRDDTLRESYMFMYEADPNALEAAEVSSRTVIALDGMLNRKANYILYTLLQAMSSMEYITQYMPDRYIWNKVVLGRDPERIDVDKEYWDMILAESMIREIWFTSENEAVSMMEKATDMMSSTLGILLHDDLLTDVMAKADSQKVYKLMEQLQRIADNNQPHMSPKIYQKYARIDARYQRALDDIGDKWDAVGKGLKGFTTLLKTSLAFANDLMAFSGRDQVMDDALRDFLNYPGYYYLSDGAVLKMCIEYDGYTTDASSYALGKAILSTISEEAIDAAIGPFSLVLDGYGIATGMMPEYQATLDSMVAYQTSLLSIAMQHEAHDDAYRGILLNDKGIHTSLSGEDLDKEILQAYLYFKSCAATRSLVEKAFVYEDYYLKPLYQLLTVLESTYGASAEDRPSSYAERIAAVTEPDDVCIKNAIALYLSVSGAVVTFKDEKPVPNAICKVTEHEMQRVWFQADGNGKYDTIYIPVFWTADGITQFDPDFDIKLFFYSEEEGMEGDDTKYVAFQAKEELPVSDAHLLQKGSMEAFVTDKDTGEAIDGASYDLELLDTEIYEGIIEVQKNFSGISDISGYILQEEMAPGRYRAVFSAEGYESKEVEIEIRSGEVTSLSVELEKQRIWLLVAKDEKDIAMGFWSQYLEYAYDDGARLVEVTGSDRDYQACVYDEDGRLIKQIEGTSGGYGTWTAQDYSYDADDRVIRIDYSVLTYYSAKSMSDWKKASVFGSNGTDKLKYEGDLLAEKTRYLPNGDVNYRITYEYDADGRLVKEITKDAKGNQTYLTSYQYNDKGLLVQKDEDGTRGVTILYEYDEEDRLSKEQNLYTGYTTYSSYDENGNLSVQKVYSNNGKQAWQYEYYYKLFPFEED